MPDDAAPTRWLGPLMLDDEMELVVPPEGRPVALTRQQYCILTRLAQRPGRVVTVDQLLAALYFSPDDEPENAHMVVRVQVCHLRRRLRAIKGAPTVKVRWGTGYYLEAAA